MTIEQPTNEIAKTWEEERFLASVDNLIKRYPNSEKFIRAVEAVIIAKNRPNPDQAELDAALNSHE